MIKKLGKAIALISTLAGGGLAQAGGPAGTLYAVDSSREVFEINMATGAKTYVSTISANAGTIGALTYEPISGEVYASSTSTDSLYTINLATGIATLIGGYGNAAIIMHGLEWDTTNNVLYGSSSHNGGLYTINSNNGLATYVGPNNWNGISNLVFVPSVNRMYGTNTEFDRFYIVVLEFGAFVNVGQLQSGAGDASSLAYNSADNEVYMVDNVNGNLYTVSTTNGFATLVGNTGPGNLLGLVYIPPTPGMVTISGTLSLLNTVPSPGYSRTLSVEVQSGANVYTTSAQISGAGSYSLNVPESLIGAATIRADGSSFLKTESPINLVGTNVTKNLTLRNGDVDNSGEVDAADIDLVIAAFGSTGEQVEDVDMSGEVDAADIDIVIASFGETDN